MKTKGRPKSKNVIYQNELEDKAFLMRANMFLQDSLANPNPGFKPQLTKPTLNIDQILQRQVNGR